MARKSKVPVDMSALLQSSQGTLAQIQEKTNSLTILADIVRQICPDLPADAFKIANFHQSVLVVEVKSPVWGQRLQFERNNICRVLIEQTQGQFQQIEIKVNPNGHREAKLTAQSHSTTRESKPLKTLSDDAAAHILNLASNLTHNAPAGLKEKLQRLAELSKRKKCD